MFWFLKIWVRDESVEQSVSFFVREKLQTKTSVTAGIIFFLNANYNTCLVGVFRGEFSVFENIFQVQLKITSNAIVKLSVFRFFFI